ncbi:MAG: biosynthetic arginine decarboxylase [Candidatus Dasytiphilus stammeri]
MTIQSDFKEVIVKNSKINQMLYTSNICYWGNNYFNINELGHLMVCPTPNEEKPVEVNFTHLLQKTTCNGLQLPALFCFPQILQHRLRSINAAFRTARNNYDYQGDYLLIYPIKVNQHYRVIESLINSGENLGLESGSKAELMVVLAHTGIKNMVIVCNGYKDNEYIRLALIGSKLGHKIYLVIEKLTELIPVLKIAEHLKVTPRLGVRIRLASQSSGKCQSPGGDQSKFGLATLQILQLVEMLKKANMLQSLQLLHFHMGSQLANLRDIVCGIREAARCYVELHKLGVQIRCFDVGGGLGVDYQGTRSDSDFSVNYSLNEYAKNVIFSIGEICKEYCLPHPIVITESGRAITAHHTVLVSNIINVEIQEFNLPEPLSNQAPKPLMNLWHTWQQIQVTHEIGYLIKWLSDSKMDFKEINTGYIHGSYDLKQRALAEQFYLNICNKIKNSLDLDKIDHRPIINQLQKVLADKLYVNFSLFNSMLDVWGINQLFPILPLEGLNLPAERRAIILDITCDSDGAINHYIDGNNIATTLPMPHYDKEHPPLLGFFMLGAYQEILGNLHNLFGKTKTVNVYISSNGKYELECDSNGNNIADMLFYVGLDPDKSLDNFINQMKSTNLDEKWQNKFLDEFETLLSRSPYLQQN